MKQLNPRLMARHTVCGRLQVQAAFTSMILNVPLVSRDPFPKVSFHDLEGEVYCISIPFFMCIFKNENTHILRNTVISALYVCGYDLPIILVNSKIKMVHVKSKLTCRLINQNYEL